MFTSLFKFETGVEVKSKTLGIKGLIVARANHLYGCDRYLVQTPLMKDGKIGEAWWTDEADLEVIGKGINKSAPKKTGGLPSRKA